MNKTAMMELIDLLDVHIGKHKEKAGKFDTGAMVARNHAIRLLDKEQRQLEDSFDFGIIDSTIRTGSRYYQKTYGNDNKERSGLERLRLLQD